MGIPIEELFKAQRKAEKKAKRKDWLSIHTFDLVNLFLSLTAIGISIAGLILK